MTTPAPTAGLTPPAGVPSPAGSPSRIDWLFRDALRNHQIHPLMELVRRYRTKDMP